MSLLRRRMMQSAVGAAAQFVPLQVTPWTLSSTITGSGQDTISNPAAIIGAVCQTYYPMKQGDQVVRTKQNVDGDGTPISLWVHEYSGTGGQSNWLRRTYIFEGSPLTIGANTRYVRFVFAYNSSTGKTMTQAIINNYFAVSYKEV